MSTQSWLSNSGQVTEDGSRNPALQSASILTLLQQQNQQAGTQTQSASSSLDEPQGGSGQYQPTGNNETQLAGDDLNSNVFVNAQLTHLISRDGDAQGQDATNVPDVLMPDAPAVHDIATQRRIIGGRCRRWCISAQPPSGKRRCAAFDSVWEYDSLMVKRVYNSGATVKPIIATHIVSTEAPVMIMNSFQNKLQMRMQMMQAPANGTPSPQTAADAELLLPFAQDRDQASTAAPPDDERRLVWT